jgi:hypothetical protein
MHHEENGSSYIGHSKSQINLRVRHRLATVLPSGGLSESRVTIELSGGHVASWDDCNNSLKSLGRSIALAPEFVDGRETFFGRSTEPIAQILLHLVIFVHVVQLGDFANHTFIIPYVRRICI